jgi:catechol 2,3-dioxygenase-like lactoylglutathione lyase family enzyme
MLRGSSGPVKTCDAAAVLGDAMVRAIVPVSDRDRALEFYRDLLGLEVLVLQDELGEARLQVGAAELVLYKSVGAGQSRHTLAAFDVDDIEEAVARLRAKGIVFEEYDLPGLKTENGITTLGDTKAAWFKDPDGNILAVEQTIRE